MKSVLWRKKCVSFALGIELIEYKSIDYIFSELLAFISLLPSLFMISSGKIANKIAEKRFALQD